MDHKSLINSEQYCIMTFSTTHSALQAEKILEMTDLPFLLVPTPREISAGCGLCVRFFEKDFVGIRNHFEINGIKVNNCYIADKKQGGVTIKPYIG